MSKVTGGKVLDKKLSDLGKLLKEPKTLRVGFLEKAKYPDGKPVAMIAAIQNFGAPKRGIPPRPFFSNMIQHNKAGWAPAVVNLLKQKPDVDWALRMMGEGIKGQLQQSIRDTNDPPLKASTIKRKGFDKPLIHTSHMINSVDYDVTD